VVVPKTSLLVAGQALHETQGWSDFINPDNYLSLVAGETIATVVVDFVGSTAQADATFADGDTNVFDIIVTDTAGHSRRFSTIPLLVLHAAPALLQAINPRAFFEGSGVQTFDLSHAFAGGDLTYDIAPLGGVVIDPQSGIVTVDTDVASPQLHEVEIAVSNSGGTLTAILELTITGVGLNIGGLAANPNFGLTPEVGSVLTGQMDDLPETVNVVHRWSLNDTVITGATGPTFSPSEADVLSLLRYIPVVDGTALASMGYVVRHAPPTATLLQPIHETQGSGTLQVNLAAGFSGLGLVFDAAADWATVSGSILTIADEVRDDVVQITAANSGGAAQLNLYVTLVAPIAQTAFVDNQDGTVALASLGTPAAAVFSDNGDGFVQRTL